MLQSRKNRSFAKSTLIQSAVILTCSVLVGIVFNIIRPNGIPFFAKPLSDFNDSRTIGEYIIERIDLEKAIELYYQGVIFVDARDEIEYNNGHIPGAIKSDPFDELVNILFDDLGFNEPFAVYCDDEECGMSENLAYDLQAEGFSVIYVFQGGWELWLTTNMPIEK